MAYPNELFKIELNGVAVQGNQIGKKVGIIPAETGLLGRLGLIYERPQEPGDKIDFTLPKRDRFKKVRSVPYATQSYAFSGSYQAAHKQIKIKPAYEGVRGADAQNAELFVVADQIRAKVFADRLMERGRYEDIHYVQITRQGLDANKATNVLEIEDKVLDKADEVANAMALIKAFNAQFEAFENVSNDFTPALGKTIHKDLKVIISPKLKYALKTALMAKAIDPKYAIEEGESYMMINGVKLHVLNALGANVSYSDLGAVDARRFHALFVLDLGERTPALPYVRGMNYAQQAKDPITAGIYYASYRASEGASVWDELAKFAIRGVYTKANTS